MATSKSRSKGAAAGGKKATAVKSASSKNAAQKKTAAKKSTAPKKAAPKKAAAKKAAPKKAASKRAAPKKAAPKKAAAARPAAAKKSAPSKSASRNGSRSAAAAGRSTASTSRSSASASRNTKASADPRNDLEMILVDLMKDIYYAEKKITKALAKMSKKCSNDQLRDAFETHRAETEDQIQKLERAFELIGQKVKAKKCAAMDGLVEESDEHMKEYDKGAGLDVALLVGAQKVEHYEIASYGSMRSIADTLGYTEAAGIFEDILEQERDTDEKLTQIAETVVNLEAEDEKEGEDITSENGNSGGGFDSEAGEDSSSAVSGSKRGQSAGVEDNDGGGRGISSLTDGNDRGETSETGPAMGY